ncbi:phosphoenolpyruvate carboxylase [Hellea sp.]|nr:phosphoenolpyruvate carboxylase [Hellea sp.]MDC1061456.1 phosphoenolpyruvate carboxylase [Hellea sp.]
MTRKKTSEELNDQLKTKLIEYKNHKDSDPQSNAIKLLAYDLSKDVEDRAIAFKDIESLVKSISDKSAINRSRRLRKRAGICSDNEIKKSLEKIAYQKAKEGFKAFKSWAESPGIGIVLTAHPTFSLSRDVRNCLGKIASSEDNKYSSSVEKLKNFPYLPKRAPTLKEEHEDTQVTLERIQAELDSINSSIVSISEKLFPDDWKSITPHLINAYSWVGYDIDGRTDISWGDALRLRLQEKRDQLFRYKISISNINNKYGKSLDKNTHLIELLKKMSDAHESAENDLTLFEKDITNPENLVDAANNLTRVSTRRFLNLKNPIKIINKIIENNELFELNKELICLRSKMIAFGLGTARIHFRLNNQHVVSALKSTFGITEHTSDKRTLLLRASKLTKNVKVQSVNFASLALEKSTAHEKMILTAQIHKYIDDETPIRLLIAECEDSLTPMGMLYLAKRYGIEKHLDISPLFETADALNNGGRIIGKMLSNEVYRDYIKDRGVFAIQTGFSDAGRFMGQIPATLAIERLHSHFASQMEKFGIKDVTAVIFNTHGESSGRGGHSGSIIDRVNYVMSPWAMRQFEKRALPICHETSFQGGDGFMWFQTKDLAKATINSLLKARYTNKKDADDDIFYKDTDFSWDVFRTISSQQESLYNDPNYIKLLSGFGQNLLIPTGSRASKRSKSDTGMFDPRQLRAIPHNAILQQFGIPANIFYGIGKAVSIDIEKFSNHYKNSARAHSIFSLAFSSLERSNMSILSAYGRLFDPGFWVSRGLSNNEPRLEKKSLTVASTLKSLPWRSQIMDLANQLRMDSYNAIKFFVSEMKENNEHNIEDLEILHALRLSVIMKMMIIATELPAAGEESSSPINVLQKLQTFQIDSVIRNLKDRYPEKRSALEWTEQLQEKTNEPVAPSGGFPHITESIIKPLERAGDLVRQITVAITHHYDAYG